MQIQEERKEIQEHEICKECKMVEAEAKEIVAMVSKRRLAWL